MRKLTLVVAIVLTGLLIGTLAAKKGEVELKDGRQFIGDITETDDGYEVNQPGVGSVTFKKADVKNIDYFDTMQEAYQKKKARVAKNDAAAMYALAQWAQRHDLNNEMGDAAKAVLAISPNHVGARLLLAAYERNKITRPSNGGATTSPPTGEPVSPPPDPDKQPTKSDRISDKDINMIRLIEMLPGEELGITFSSRDFVTEFLKRNETNDAVPRNFITRQAHEQLRIIMENTSLDEFHKLAEHVNIRRDPASMMVWRRPGGIHRWVISSCGSPSCHGGSDKTPFRLVTDQPQNESAFYTNFLIVSEFVGRDGRRLLDRDQPDRSLLLQYALVPNLAEAHHPKVNDQPIPVVLRAKSGMYDTIVKWLEVREPAGLRSGLNRLPYRINLPTGQAQGVQAPPPVRPMPPGGLPPGQLPPGMPGHLPPGHMPPGGVPREIPPPPE